MGDDGGPMSMDDASFGIEKLKLQGAVCKSNQLSVSSTIVTDLQAARLRWLRSGAGGEVDKAAKQRTITLPIYLNATRSDVLFKADFTLADDQSHLTFHERGVALIAS